MKVINLSENFNEVIKEAVLVLKRGGIIVYPTDTLYGLGANALDQYAVDKIFKIKKRPKTKPLPIAIKNINWAKELAYVNLKEERILKVIWPGKVTVVLQKRKIVPYILTANKKSVAMRMINLDFVDKILSYFGYPITSTSANISNEEHSNKISKIIERFKKEKYQPDLIIDAGDLRHSEPSTILDLTTDKPKILRIGPTKPEELMRLLEI